MKKIMLMLAIAVTGMANAQEGTILVGGNVGITSEKVGDNKYSTFEFSPTVGYQFNENMTVGLQASIANSKDETSTMVGTTTSVSEYTENMFKIGAFYRYTQPLSDLFAVFADVSAGYQTAKAENTVTGMPATSLKANGFYAGITPALFINMKNSFGLNFSIGGLQYNSMTTDTTPSVKSSGFDFNFGKTVNIGISKNF
ncbi:porin family protein [Flavobacterium sp. CBA20B-1]|uniref:porin family protein n=1 Tax=unclassified Flavobacterium TaxID=196869 RepID=UPI00222539EE|nr:MULTISPECIES: porin family protein [unclassified Flavobacterium]WCM42232.1 porin family protein [Flavobacterium sp. CBA20B-1]